MPTKPAPQPYQPSVAEIETQRSQDWTRFVDSRIEAHAKANEWQHEATLEAIGQAHNYLSQGLCEKIN